MKNVILGLIFLFFYIDGFTQSTSTVYFEYDAAGNRTRRYLIVESNSARLDSSKKNITPSDSLNLGDVKIDVYPNPILENELNIKVIGLKNQETLEYALIDVRGNLILKDVLNSGIKQLNFAAYPFGSYLLRVTGEKYIKTWKLIK